MGERRVRRSRGKERDGSEGRGEERLREIEGKRGDAEGEIMF